MSANLIGYEAMQRATTTQLGFMPEFVEIGADLVKAYRDYWQTNESVELSGAMVQLGKLSQRYGVEFDIAELINALAEEVGNE